jgi:processive 1,2-diacylglycerol beta-glucosyltransferase
MRELGRATRRSVHQLERLRTRRGIERRKRGRHPLLQEGSAQHGSAGSDRACRVMILSAAVGCGHNAAAEGLREELASTTREAHVTLCNGLGRTRGALRVFLERFTRWQLVHCPAVYSWFYLLGVRWRPGRSVTSRLLYRISRTRLASLTAEHRPDVVVCTYPGVIAPLALMRLRGEISIPVCALITDLASLHFWAHPGVDLHLASYSESLKEIERIAAGVDTKVVRPPLRATHWRPRRRSLARVTLGLDPETPVVVISGGGWGVGNLAGAIAAALAIAEIQVIVVCGENQQAHVALGARFGSIPRVRVLGFTHEMADLLSAASVLVHSTGGMTCLEAAAHRCPVVAYGLRAGHIAHNTSAMMRHSLVEHAGDAPRLTGLLEKAISSPPPAPSPIGDRQSAASAVLELADLWASAKRRSSGPAPETRGIFASGVPPTGVLAVVQQRPFRTLRLGHLARRPTPPVEDRRQYRPAPTV